AVCVAALWLLFHRTQFGRQVRALASDRMAAQMQGIRVARMSMLTFGLAGGLSALAGVLIAPTRAVTVDLGFGPMLYAFAASILGGMGSIGGVVEGALAIGLVQQLGGGYISPDYAEAYPFVLMLLVISLRPQGAFGSGAGAWLGGRHRPGGRRAGGPAGPWRAAARLPAAPAPRRRRRRRARGGARPGGGQRLQLRAAALLARLLHRRAGLLPGLLLLGACRFRSWRVLRPRCLRLGVGVGGLVLRLGPRGRCRPHRARGAGLRGAGRAQRPLLLRHRHAGLQPHRPDRLPRARVVHRS